MFFLSDEAELSILWSNDFFAKVTYRLGEVISGIHGGQIQGSDNREKRRTQMLQQTLKLSCDHHNDRADGHPTLMIPQPGEGSKQEPLRYAERATCLLIASEKFNRHLLRIVALKPLEDFTANTLDAAVLFWNNLVSARPELEPFLLAEFVRAWGVLRRRRAGPFSHPWRFVFIQVFAWLFPALTIFADLGPPKRLLNA